MIKLHLKKIVNGYSKMPISQTTYILNNENKMNNHILVCFPAFCAVVVVVAVFKMFCCAFSVWEIKNNSFPYLQLQLINVP
jgi:hypothetical protein